MIDFSLRRIQQQAPYEITITEGGFVFRTDCGVLYNISFEKEDMVLGGCDVYQLILQNVAHAHAAFDINVERTILAVVHEFFRSNHDVLLYLCDSSDHREEARNRLFLMWFKRNAESGKFTICTANTHVEGQGFYAAIIVDNLNPRLADITAEFEETANMLTNKPEE